MNFQLTLPEWIAIVIVMALVFSAFALAVEQMVISVQEWWTRRRVDRAFIVYSGWNNERR